MNFEQIIEVLENSIITEHMFCHCDIFNSNFEKRLDLGDFKFSNQDLVDERDEMIFDESKWDRSRYDELRDLIDDSQLDQEYLEHLGLGPWEIVSNYGGQGKGDDYWAVILFPKHNVHIKISGWYSSYEPIHFSDGFGKEVMPKQKTITVWE